MSNKVSLPDGKGNGRVLKHYIVGCAACPDYSDENVNSALRVAIEKAGGLPSVGKQVLLKPNLLSPREPYEAVTSHPTIVRETASLLKEKFPASSLLVADNPGYIFTDRKESLFRATGMWEIKKEGLAEVSLLSRDGYKSLRLPKSLALERVSISSIWLSSDSVINIAKLKTHVETEITASIKNVFGTADRDTRMAAHSAKGKAHLYRSIIDLFLVRPPEFNILDAVWCMEGNGPSRGMPRFAGWVLASRNALALDAVAAFMMGYVKPFSVPFLEEAAKSGLGPRGMEEIEVRGAKLEELRIPSFKKATSVIGNIPERFRGFCHRLLFLYPELIPEKCVSCGVCEKVCPVQAITIKRIPEIDRSKCVKCLCCHEMCPEGAMTVKENLLLGMLRKISRTGTW